MNAPEHLDTTFVKLSKVDVSKHIEKKGQFSYLSWPFAVSQLRQAEPSAVWEVVRFEGLPYLKTELGYFVEVAVTVNGITLSQIHPVLDARNKAIPAPSPFDINTSIQRCLVKAIALHGLGLGIYAGEDLPLIADEIPEPTVEEISLAIEALTLASKGGVVAFQGAVAAIPDAVKAKINPEIKKKLFAQAKAMKEVEEVSA